MSLNLCTIFQNISNIFKINENAVLCLRCISEFDIGGELLFQWLVKGHVRVTEKSEVYQMNKLKSHMLNQTETTKLYIYKLNG